MTVWHTCGIRVAYVWHRLCRPHATLSGLRIHARRSLSTTWPRCRRGYVRSSRRSTSSAPPRRSPSVQSMPSRPSVKSFITNRTRSSRLWAPARLVPPASLQQGRHGVVLCGGALVFSFTRVGGRAAAVHSGNARGREAERGRYFAMDRRLTACVSGYNSRLSVSATHLRPLRRRARGPLRSCLGVRRVCAFAKG